jgi:lysophospholipase L1-like esterase
VAAVAALAACAPASLAQPYLGDITRWTDQDALDPVDPGAVLFIGSSSIRRWEQLTRDFADYRIVQRGFGGAQFEDLNNNYVDDIVLPYQPGGIVIWLGTNDLSSGESAAEVFADYQSFVTLVRAGDPSVPILFLGVTPTPANGGTTAARDAANALISAEAAGDPTLHYIDLPAYFNALTPGELDALYVDPVHLNRAGYDIWTTLVRPELEAVVAPNKVFVPNADTLQPGERLLFDFGPSNPDDGNQTLGPDANGNIWNNWHPAEGEVAINAGERVAGLVDTDGNPTGIRLTITGGFQSNGILNGGLLNPNPALLGDFAVPTATQDYFFFGADGTPGGGNDDVPGGFMLDGLDPALVYKLRFFATRNSSAQARVTRYEVYGANEGVATLQTSGSNIGADGAYDGNDDRIAVVTGVRPDAFGQVFVDCVLLQGTFGYLGAVELAAVESSFSAHPEDAIVSPGGTLSFTASAEVSGSGATYGWERDGVALVDDARISGAQTQSLTIAGAGAADNGSYRLVVTASTGSVASEAAVGAVRPASNPFDVNQDGAVDLLDVLDLAEAFSGGA